MESAFGDLRQHPQRGCVTPSKISVVGLTIGMVCIYSAIEYFTARLPDWFSLNPGYGKNFIRREEHTGSYATVPSQARMPLCRENAAFRFGDTESITGHALRRP
ncbi:predicted protein [Plenodomus lingam JN3]|uniref:Predicted protein n=1 Tax=Leptosphaeria maculans (strain JN3 / isolate v23.1.3 / race Av1-4-5-6-7-8) TaxID=985895 RepID=E5ADT6_LEPMJ|nr:predicted protein [Plenodomus lingam JN3]CBY01375.1 predicted protein [Plenodomus lingam JN3]